MLPSSRFARGPALFFLLLVGPCSLGAQSQTSAPAVQDAPHTEAQGALLMARGHYVAAMEVFDALQPKTASVYNQLGIACEHMFMADRARESFERAVQLNPHYAQAYNNLGTLAHSQKDFKHAEKYYKKAIKLDPKNAIVEQNLGTLYYAQGKYKKGDLAYRRALAIDPAVLGEGALHSIAAATDSKGMAELNYHLAKAFAQSGNDQVALEYLGKAVLEGFKDRKRLMEDPEFAKLRQAPGFGSLLADLARNGT